MKVIGITGSIGTGKSTFTKLLSEKFSLHVIDADELVKEIHKDKETIKRIKEAFKDNLYDKNDNLNKLKMSEIIFSDEEKREKLNKSELP